MGDVFSNLENYLRLWKMDNQMNKQNRYQLEKSLVEAILELKARIDDVPNQIRLAITEDER